MKKAANKPKKEKKIVLTTGVYDILHRGHLHTLKTASSLGDILVVAIMEDQAVYKSKGQYPTLTLEERIDQMKAIPYVHKVTTYSSGSDGEIVRRIKPHIMVHGEDWFAQNIDRSRVLKVIEKYNVQLVLIPHVGGLSGTKIKKRIIESQKRKN